MKFFLNHDTARQRAQDAIKAAPEGWVVTIAEPNRTEAASALFHAICDDIEASGKLFLGKPRKAKVWKILLISGHATATGLGSEVVAGLEGEFINIRESSAKMSGKRMASLNEYAISWATLEGVKLNARK